MDKRYLLFAYSEYYPQGGLGDMAGSYNTIAEAILAARENIHDYKYLYDRVLGVSIDNLNDMDTQFKILQIIIKHIEDGTIDDLIASAHFYEDTGLYILNSGVAVSPELIKDIRSNPDHYRAMISESKK